MKKLFVLLASSVLLFSLAACQTAKTTTEAPNSTTDTAQAPAPDTAKDTQKDATNDTRQRQLNSDIRSREQRNNTTGGDADRADGDLASEVRSKLEANLPASQLAVDAKNGAVTVSGTVPTSQQLAKVEPLAKEIKGVQNVKVNVKVAPTKSDSNKPGA